jgi:hypothetical protein
MFSTLLALHSRARRISAISLVGTAMFAACDADEPIAPKAAQVPTAAAPGLRTSTGSLVVKLVDGSNAIIPIDGAGFSVEGPGNTKSVIMDVGSYDNYDSDPTPGAILMKALSPGQYKLCEGLTPAGFGVQNPRCQTIGVTAGATSTLTFHHLPIAHVKWTVTDYASNFIGGSVFTVDSNNVVIGKIGDGSVHDSDPAPGKFDVKIPAESYYKVCVTTPPAGYMFPVNQIECAAADIKQGTVTNFGNFGVNPVYSAYWGVTDGSLDPSSQPTLIGPSTFKLASANGLFNFDVVDNSLNDFNPVLGKIAVKLPGGGYWSICETQPPFNHWNANPSCKRIDVASGIPASADYFVNGEKAVYYPGPAPVR